VNYLYNKLVVSKVKSECVFWEVKIYEEESLTVNKTLVILAAGIGSRFGGGIKQLEPVDDHGHIIMDYSIHDAIAAGFTKIVFIIRHDIEKDFREAIGNRIENVCAAHHVEVAYAFRELLVAGFKYFLYD
jgi:hypothetical protein